MIDLPAADPAVPPFVLAVVVLAVLAAVWLAARAPGGAELVEAPAAPTGLPAESGGGLFVREGCGGCHPTVGASGVQGPSLAGAARRAAGRIASPAYTGFATDPIGYLREATVDHCVDLVPGFTYDCAEVGDVGLRLGEADLERLIDFVRNLPDPEVR